MKNIYKLMFVLFVAGALFFSCDKLETNFASLTKEYSASIESNLVFLNGNMLFEVENNSVTDVTIPIEIQVWGPLSSSDATVDISVDAAASTAQSPTHYTLSVTSVTIPAKKGGAEFNLVMHSANFAKGDTVLLVMNLSSSTYKSGLFPSTAMLKLSKKPECPFDIKTFTGSYTADETGYGKYAVDFRPDPTDPNRIWQTNFWDWTNDLLAFDLDPDNGTVTVASQQITMGDGGSYEVVGSGTYDPCTGIMIVDFQGDVDGTHEVYSPGAPGKSARTGAGKR
jgi:hypothetical protein